MLSKTKVAGIGVALTLSLAALTPAVAQDVARGEQVFRVCAACHALVEGQNRVGPSLYGLFGRTAGTVEGFRYSPANANSGVVWSAETLEPYLENPRTFMPGNRMAFAGVRNPQDRADLIAFLREATASE